MEHCSICNCMVWDIQAQAAIPMVWDMGSDGQCNWAIRNQQAETSGEDITLQKDKRSKGGESEMDRIRCLFKKWVPAEEYGRTVNPGAAHHAAQQFLKSHD